MPRTTSVATAHLADLACRLGGRTWLTALACDNDPAAALMGIVAPALVEQTLELTGPDWRAEVEIHVDLFLAAVVDDVVASTLSSETQAAGEGEIAPLLFELSRVATSPEGVWLS